MNLVEPQFDKKGFARLVAFVEFLMGHYELDEILKQEIKNRDKTEDQTSSRRLVVLREIADPILAAFKDRDFGKVDQLCNEAVDKVFWQDSVIGNSLELRLIIFICYLSRQILASGQDLDMFYNLRLLQLAPWAFWIRSAVYMIISYKQPDSEIGLKAALRFLEHRQIEERKIIIEYIRYYSALWADKLKKLGA